MSRVGNKGRADEGGKAEDGEGERTGMSTLNLCLYVYTEIEC